MTAGAPQRTRASLPVAEEYTAWATELPSGSVYGSLYSAAPNEQFLAAEHFIANGLPLHLDVILTTDAHGSIVHSGITPHLLTALFSDFPETLCEVHVITTNEHPETATALRDEISQILRLAAPPGASRVALPTQFACDRELTAEFRRTGGEVWTVISPSETPLSLAVMEKSAVSGALVMLIEPGTRQIARPELFDRATTLARSTPVGIDGGIDAKLATQAIALGIHHVVAGRALLGPTVSETVSEAGRGES